MSLLAEVVGTLQEQGVKHAVVGAAAMAVHGVGGSTLDIALLTTDARVLDHAGWKPIEQQASIVIRTGESEEPLAGVVRLSREGERDVELVVGRAQWQNACVERAEPRDIDGVAVPVVSVPDLILLKLYAGASQDKSDIEQVLGVSQSPADVATVGKRIHALPEASRELWQQLRELRRNQRKRAARRPREKAVEPLEHAQEGASKPKSSPRHRRPRE